MGKRKTHPGRAHDVSNPPLPSEAQASASSHHTRRKRGKAIKAGEQPSPMPDPHAQDYEMPTSSKQFDFINTSSVGESETSLPSAEDVQASETELEMDREMDVPLARDPRCAGHASGIGVASAYAGVDEQSGVHGMHPDLDEDEVHGARTMSHAPPASERIGEVLRPGGISVPMAMDVMPTYPRNLAAASHFDDDGYALLHTTGWDYNDETPTPMSSYPSTLGHTPLAPGMHFPFPPMDPGAVVRSQPPLTSGELHALLGGDDRAPSPLTHAGIRMGEFDFIETSQPGGYTPADGTFLFTAPGSVNVPVPVQMQYHTQADVFDTMRLHPGSPTNINDLSSAGPVSTVPPLFTAPVDHAATNGISSPAVLPLTTPHPPTLPLSLPLPLPRDLDQDGTTPVPTPIFGSHAMIMERPSGVDPLPRFPAPHTIPPTVPPVLEEYAPPTVVAPFGVSGASVGSIPIPSSATLPSKTPIPPPYVPPSTTHLMQISVIPSPIQPHTHPYHNLLMDPVPLPSSAPARPFEQRKGSSVNIPPRPPDARFGGTFGLRNPPQIVPDAVETPLVVFPVDVHATSVPAHGMPMMPTSSSMPPPNVNPDEIQPYDDDPIPSTSTSTTAAGLFTASTTHQSPPIPATRGRGRKPKTPTGTAAPKAVSDPMTPQTAQRRRGRGGGHPANVFSTPHTQMSNRYHTRAVSARELELEKTGMDDEEFLSQTTPTPAPGARKRGVLPATTTTPPPTSGIAPLIATSANPPTSTVSTTTGRRTTAKRVRVASPLHISIPITQPITPTIPMFKAKARGGHTRSTVSESPWAEEDEDSDEEDGEEEMKAGDDAVGEPREKVGGGNADDVKAPSGSDDMQKRRAKNTEAARRSRQKKASKIHTLEAHAYTLEHQTAHLTRQSESQTTMLAETLKREADLRVRVAGLERLLVESQRVVLDLVRRVEGVVSDVQQRGHPGMGMVNAPVQIAGGLPIQQQPPLPLEQNQQMRPLRPFQIPMPANPLQATAMHAMAPLHTTTTVAPRRQSHPGPLRMPPNTFASHSHRHSFALPGAGPVGHPYDHHMPIGPQSPLSGGLNQTNRIDTASYMVPPRPMMLNAMGLEVPSPSSVAMGGITNFLDGMDMRNIGRTSRDGGDTMMGDEVRIASGVDPPAPPEVGMSIHDMRRSSSDDHEETRNLCTDRMMGGGEYIAPPHSDSDIAASPPVDADVKMEGQGGHQLFGDSTAFFAFRPASITPSSSLSVFSDDHNVYGDPLFPPTEGMDMDGDGSVEPGDDMRGMRTEETEEGRRELTVVWRGDPLGSASPRAVLNEGISHSQVPDSTADDAGDATQRTADNEEAWMDLNAGVSTINIRTQAASSSSNADMYSALPAFHDNDTTDPSQMHSVLAKTDDEDMGDETTGPSASSSAAERYVREHERESDRSGAVDALYALAAVATAEMRGEEPR
ncbi:uncharacterized protein EV422DRAFT_508677 [Fimicolochytrium jonesii]|uniref:uncharacterized protein n=1 Tax=Fimicolochytrium jonesii TaxID=1396493 RepID=UPI0022FDF78A|nr:uncharacterized protein EV422DRAFT_508677 [Fimicolochytrium jonesii]KAI8817856.1 hypothetical protein EV422DRAFT_508677 [Fimicolochytrium jonesii]